MTSSHLSFLPQELLVQIFSLATETLDDLNKNSLICKKLRTVITPLVEKIFLKEACKNPVEKGFTGKTIVKYLCRRQTIVPMELNFSDLLDLRDEDLTSLIKVKGIISITMPKGSRKISELALINFLKNSPQLESLELSLNENIVHIISEYNQNLKHLNIDYFLFKDCVCCDLKPLKKLKKLETLIVAGNCSLDSIFIGTFPWEKLSKLKITWNAKTKINDSILENIVSVSPHLKSISLGTVTDSDLSTLEKCSQLDSLEVLCQQISKEAFIHLLQNCTKLKKLKLRESNGFDEDSLTEIFSHLPPDLESLELTENLTEKTAKTLSQCSNLKKISRGSSSFISAFSTICPDTIKSISEFESINNDTLKNFASRCTHLEKIDFFNHSVTNKGLREFAKHCPNLKKFIVYNPIIDEDKEGLKGFAQSCKKLEEVRVYGNFTNQDFFEFATNCIKMRRFESGLVEPFKENVMETIGKNWKNLHELVLRLGFDKDDQIPIEKSLKKFAENCKQLSSFKITSKHQHSLGESLSILIKNNPLLSEIHLSTTWNLSSKEILGTIKQAPSLSRLAFRHPENIKQLIKSENPHLDIQL